MKNFFLPFLVCISLFCNAQDLAYTRKMLDTLTSKALWGRGYTKQGMEKAAILLESEFRSLGLSSIGGAGYRQHFSYPVNTFPGRMEVKVNGKMLRPGVDFIVGPASGGMKGKIRLTKKDSVTFVNEDKKFVVSLRAKLTWPVARTLADLTEILVIRSAISGNPVTAAVNIENIFEPDFKAANICGMVKGTKYPDSMIILTAHYDHLGGMGRDTYFPGANDNASGVSFLLSMAKYYAANPQPYSIGFICFAGEEAGLLGSKYFTENPLINLKKIRFLINLDLVGTGEGGMTVVNATVYPNEFNMLSKLNNEQKLFVKINQRGKAPNSDHYWFTEKGVPAFFIYTQGGISAYHDVFDIATTLPFTEYNDLFTLIRTFNEYLMK